MKGENNINIEEYYIHYGPMVLRRCRYLLKDEDRSYDAMQEVFVKLLINRDSLQGTYPSSLLFRIATNVCLNIIRSESKTSSMGNENLLANIASHENAEDKIISEDLIDYIFQGEKATTREIAVMHYIDGMTLKETADEVGLSVSGVRKRLRNLRTKVRGLEELDYAE